jgi:hypothetical protein
VVVILAALLAVLQEMVMVAVQVFTQMAAVVVVVQAALVGEII